MISWVLNVSKKGKIPSILYLILPAERTILDILCYIYYFVLNIKSSQMFAFTPVTFSLNFCSGQLSWAPVFTVIL